MRSVMLLSSWMAVACTSRAPAELPRPIAPVTPTNPSLKPEERLVDLGLVKLFVRTVGGAAATRTIVALHGGPGISHEYMRAFEVLASETTRVVTYDQRGVGRSTAPADETAYRFDQQAHDLEQLRARVGAAQLDLIAHSYGGPLAMQYAILYPRRTRTLILVDSAPPGGGDWNQAQFSMGFVIRNLQADGVLPVELPPSEGDDCSKNLIAILPAYFHDRDHPMTKHLAGSKCFHAVANLTIAANDPHDMREGVATLTTPTIVIHGMADPFGTEIAELTAAAFTRAKPKLEMLEKCGHVPFEECPDRLFAIVRAFLASVPDAAAR